MVIGLDGKLTWDSKGQPVLSAPGRDAIVVVDLVRPDRSTIVATLPNPNSIIGPPVNLAVAPDGSLAIVANSVSNGVGPTMWRSPLAAG